MSEHTDSSLYDQGNDRRKWLRRGVAAVAGLAAVGVGYGIHEIVSTDNDTDKAQLAIGVVKCAGSQAIQGVWIETGYKDDSGWAKITPPAGIASSVAFTKNIQHEVFTIHAGCNGNYKNWAIADYATSYSPVNEPVGYFCDPAPATAPTTKSPDKGTCSMETLTIPKS